MSILVAVLLGILGLAFVLQPLYGQIHIKTQDSKPAGSPSFRVKRRTLSEVVYQSFAAIADVSARSPNPQLPIEIKTQQTEHEQAARSALQEVEFDFQLGNLAEDDYRSLRERYMRRALSALKLRHDHERELDEVIEEQVRKLQEENENAHS